MDPFFSYQIPPQLKTDIAWYTILMTTLSINPKYIVHFRSPNGVTVLKGTLHEFQKTFPHLYYGGIKEDEETITHSTVCIYADPQHKYLIGYIKVPSRLTHLFD